MTDAAAQSGRSSAPRELDPSGSIPNPLRTVGVAYIVASGWFIASGAATLREYDYLLTQIARLFAGKMGATDAPLRALLVLLSAVALVLLGFRLLVVGLRWRRRLHLPAEGPAALARSEVVAALRHHTLPAYESGPTESDSLLQRWLTDERGAMTRWRRELLGRGVRIMVWSCVLVLAISALWLLTRFLAPEDWLGPFPTSFVVLLPFISATWVILAFLVIPAERLRVESMELVLPARVEVIRGDAEEAILESRPRLLDYSSGLTNMLGLTGVAVQCLTPVCWDLSHIGYPLLATSILRHTGAIVGGVVFYHLGRWIVRAAAELSRYFRYDSTVVVIDGVGDEIVARAAAIRTEGRALTGPRHVIAAVGSAYVRESALALLAAEGRAFTREDDTRWRRPVPPSALADRPTRA